MSESNLARAVRTQESPVTELLLPSRPELRVVAKASDPPRLKKRRRAVPAIVLAEGPFRLFRVW